MRGGGCQGHLAGLGGDGRSRYRARFLVRIYILTCICKHRGNQEVLWCLPLGGVLADLEIGELERRCCLVSDLM